LYNGSFVKDKYDGHGVFYYGDNGKYDGKWKKGLREGDGNLIK
jgi:hypothetical protein